MSRIFALFSMLVLSIGISKANSWEKADKLATKMPGSATKTVQAMSDYIKANLTDPEERVRAAYMWISKNISYDKNGTIDLTTSYDTDSAANVVLKKEKGVCNDFAELFQKLSISLDLDCYTITGYIATGGKVNDEGHVWNAIHYPNGTWLLYDVMLGAGSLSNGKFSKKQNTEYFAAEPGQLIKTHMPFDPVWQLLDYPFKAENFYKAEFSAKNNVYFNYNDSIKAGKNLFKSEQLEGLCRRLLWSGDVNTATSTMLEIGRHNIDVLKKKEKYALEFRNITAFNGVVDHINVSIAYYNKYKSAKKKIKGKVPVTQLSTMIDSCISNLSGAQTILNKLSFDKEEQIKQQDNLKKTVSDLQRQIDIEGSWLKKNSTPKKNKRANK